MKTISLLLFALSTLLLSSCYITRAYKYRKFELKDIDKFDTAHLPKSNTPFVFAKASMSRYPRLTGSLDSILRTTKTYAFLVIKNDTIIYERYFNGITEDRYLPSFSVAKSFVSTLVAIAHEEGKIKSLQEPITNYLPSLLKRNKHFAQITIQHVLDMSSGVKNSENYSNPFSDVLKLGFTKNIRKKTLRLKIERAPGVNDYKSVNTQLLSLIVEKATGKKIQAYMREKLWQPLGMESDATWNVDSKRRKEVRAFCCLNATARDFAKLGRLFLHNGNWRGQQIVSQDWVQASTHIDTMVKYDGYKNQWWSMYSRKYFTDTTAAVAFAAQQPGKGMSVRSTINREGKKFYNVGYYSGAFHAEGILGQYIYVNPKTNVIIVRLGYYWQHPSTYADGLIYDLGEKLK
jgi:CubicO group peptidase (beta-lactamase class C family)